MKLVIYNNDPWQKGRNSTTSAACVHLFSAGYIKQVLVQILTVSYFIHIKLQVES